MSENTQAMQEIEKSMLYVGALYALVLLTVLGQAMF